MRLPYLVLTATLLITGMSRADEQRKPAFMESYLTQGELTRGEAAAAAELRRQPQDSQLQFGLGVIQFFRAVEGLGQGLYTYGVRSERGQQLQIPFLRLPLPVNPEPRTATYPALRTVLGDFQTRLRQAEATLATIKDEQVKLPLRVGAIQLDLTGAGNGKQNLSAILARYFGGGRAVSTEKLFVVFDRGDVAWLRGYCHLLLALTDIALAYDGQELFDCTGQVFFHKIETPHRFLNERQKSRVFDVGDGLDLVDLISFIHLLRLPLKEPARMQTALGHLEQMLTLSRESWKSIQAETDDDYEWLPNPKQKGALGVPIRQEMIDSWLAFVDEAEQLLQGKRLAPFWRGNQERGVNLRRVFTEPRTFDLVLWVQGTAATPYLEQGPLTRPEVWGRLQQVFQGQFFGFAIWFN